MKTIKDVLQILKKHEQELKSKYKVRNIKVFGSYAEGKQKPNSDLDLIVCFEETPTFFKLIELENFLKEILGIEVDLLTEKSINPLIKPYIKELVVL